jgi:hypothetical protein
MTRELLRSLLVVAVITVIGASTLMLFAGQGTPSGKGKSEWEACPLPPCTIICDPEPADEVLCKMVVGGSRITSYACCCCVDEPGQYIPL